jgi:membrane protease YdiL (CAAX protease family)
VVCLDNGKRVEPASPWRIAGWLFAAVAIGTLWQVVRLQQLDAAAWLARDYGMRLTTLAVLAIDPRVRAAVFRRKRLKISLAVVICWSFWLIPLTFLMQIGGRIYGAYLPDFRVGFYPRPDGWLNLFDLTFGIALVALHEELVFRRAVPHALAHLGDGKMLIVVSALVFGAFHWWTGIPNMAYATAFGVLAMLIYRRAGALWPVMVMHYLADLWAFT